MTKAISAGFKFFNNIKTLLIFEARNSEKVCVLTKQFSFGDSIIQLNFNIIRFLSYMSHVKGTTCRARTGQLFNNIFAHFLERFYLASSEVF